MKNLHTKWLLGLSLCAVLGLAQAVDRFSYNADGSQVIDSVTGLTWQRCAVGMTWNGNACGGTPVTYNQQDALSLGVSGWRLPNIKELSSIADLSRIGPAIDKTIFPMPPATGYWSSTPFVGDPKNAWYVYFDNGGFDARVRTDVMSVRLVR